METYSFDSVIIGAGVIGLSIARLLSKEGLNVLVLEKEGRSGEGISSRNSGVIHAGMYYPTSSLKAKLCIKGNAMLYDYALDNGIDHTKTGKLIISSNQEEHLKLVQIYNQGKENGVELEMITSQEAQILEPEVKCYSAILSPNTGLIDAPQYVDRLEYDIRNHGSLVIHNAEFLKANWKKNVYEIEILSEEKFNIKTEFLFNCSGLNTYKVSNNISPFNKKHIKKIYYGKGHYYKYNGHNPFSRLIYPLPGPSGLGIHASWDFSNQLKFGPDMEWVSEISYDFDLSKKKKFINSIQRYWPNIIESKLQPDYCGIRPKLYKKGQNQEDFSISSFKDHGLHGFFNLQGIESPGLTSSLAIAEYAFDLMNENI